MSNFHGPAKGLRRGALRSGGQHSSVGSFSGTHSYRVNQKRRSAQPRGVIYFRQSNFANLNDFTVNGATPTITAGELVFSAGSADFKHTLDFARYTSLDNWLIEANVKLGTIAANNSFGFGLRSVNTTGTFESSLGGYFNFDTGGTKGTVALIGGVSPANTLLIRSGTALTFVATDVIAYQIEKTGFTFTVTAWNITTDPTRSTPVSATWTYDVHATLGFGGVTITNPTHGRWCIYNFSGGFTVQRLKISSSSPQNCEFGFVGDSKSQGWCVTDQKNRHFQLLTGAGFPCTTFGSLGDLTTQTLLRIPEIIDMAPKNVFLCIGCNDIRASVSSATYIANYDSIVRQLQAAGIHVIPCTGFPESVLDQSTLDAHIISVYPNFIDMRKGWDTRFWDLGLIHPNDAGMYKIFSTILNSGRLRHPGFAFY